MIKTRFLPTILFVFINFLFVFKYSWRIIDYALPVALLYSLILLIVIIYLWRIPQKFLKPKLLYFYLGIFIAGYIVYMQYLAVESLRVDRWSVITSFLDTLFSGDFPYLAKSHLGNPPGPFPFYFIIAIPFYFIGEIGYLSLTGIISFVWYTLRFYKNNQIVFILTVLLSTSPSFLWELSVRSTLVVNMVLLLFYFSYLEKIDHADWKKILPAGIIGGLFLSTRGIIAIPILFYTAYAWLRKKEYVGWIKMMIYLVSGFILTLLPFIIWDASLFMQYNPITLQAGFLPSWLLFLFVVSSVMIGTKIKSLSQLYCTLGVFIFIIISAAWIKVIISSGFKHALLLNGFDISYFLLAVPFLLLGIPDKKEN